MNHQHIKEAQVAIKVRRRLHFVEGNFQCCNCGFWQGRQRLRLGLHDFKGEGIPKVLNMTVRCGKASGQRTLATRHLISQNFLALLHNPQSFWHNGLQIAPSKHSPRSRTRSPLLLSATPSYSRSPLCCRNDAVSQPNCEVLIVLFDLLEYVVGHGRGHATQPLNCFCVSGAAQK